MSQADLSNDPIPGVFRVLEAFYGSTRMARMWGDQDAAELAGYWRSQLEGVPHKAIEYALNHLPESVPPTVGEFRRLCLQWSPPASPRLEAPRISREEMARRAQAEREAVQAIQPRQGVEWARAILERAKHERVPVAHVDMAKRALGQS